MKTVLRSLESSLLLLIGEIFGLGRYSETLRIDHAMYDEWLGALRRYGMSRGVVPMGFLDWMDMRCRTDELYMRKMERMNLE